MKKEMKASTAALAVLAPASRVRTDVACFHLPEMRDSPLAAIFVLAQARKMLWGVGLDTDAQYASSELVAPSGLSTATGSGDAAGGGQGARGGSGRTRGPAVFEISNEGENEEEVEEVDAPPAEGMGSPLADGMAAPQAGVLAAPPALALSRGVKDHMTKAAIAAAALVSTLDTTLHVDGNEPPTPPPAGKCASEEEGGEEDEEEEGDKGDSDDNAESEE